MLVYCDRGGMDSMVWSKPLQALGYRVDTLSGGWSNYRRWVDAGLEILPRTLTFRQLDAQPMGGLQQARDALIALGEQVVDLSTLAGQRLVPGMTLGGELSPSQAGFETLLVDALRPLNPQRKVWVLGGSIQLGQLAIPPAVRDALLKCETLWIDVPLNIRVDAWSERLRETQTETAELLHAFAKSAVPPTTTTIDRWQALLHEGLAESALQSMMTEYIDACSRLDSWAKNVTIVKLTSLTSQALTLALKPWLERDAHGAQGKSE